MWPPDAYAEDEHDAGRPAAPAAGPPWEPVPGPVPVSVPRPAQADEPTPEPEPTPELTAELTPEPTPAPDRSRAGGHRRQRAADEPQPPAGQARSRVADVTASWWPLAAILVVQAVLSLRLVHADTAFQDEAAYLWAGHLEWAHWLHGTAIPPFPAYFSGAPVLYPPLGALADHAGGLAAARILSLVFMLGATAFLAATGTRLFGRRAGATR